MSTDREMRERGSESGWENLSDSMNRATNAVKSGIEAMGRLNLDESTVPDAFAEMPKLISPRVHRWLDVAVTGYFLGLGAWFVRGRKGSAAIPAFLNAAMVAGVSLLTDYDGDGRKPINFKLHGTLDALQAATAALGPVLHGFAGERHALLFYGQALNELAVIASTDWDAGMPAGNIQRAA